MHNDCIPNILMRGWQTVGGAHQILQHYARQQIVLLLQPPKLKQK